MVTSVAITAARASGRGRTRLGALVAAVCILGAGVAAFAVARAALLPDVGLWDTAEYQTVLPLLGTLHPTGFPAYVVLGWIASLVLAPFGPPAFRMDLLSAILLGVAVSGTAWLVLELTGRRSLALVAGLGLALTPIAWRIGTRADAHALHLAIVPYLLLVLVAWERRRREVDLAADEVAAPAAEGRTGSRPDRRADRLLLIAAGILGLALADHRLIVLFLPGVVAYVLVVERGILRRRRFVAACLGVAFGVAALFYLELPLRAGPFPAPIVYGHPDTLTGFWYVVLGVQFGGGLLASFSDPLGEVGSLASLAVAQFGILVAALPAALVITAAYRPRYALLTVPAALLTCLFAAGYLDADIGRYYLGPALLVWTWLAVAASWLLDLLAVEHGWGVPAGRAAPRVPGSGADPAAAEDGAVGRTDPAPGGPVPGGVPDPADDARARRLGLVATALVVAVAALAVLPAVPERWAAVSASSSAASGRAWLDAAFSAMAQDSVVVSWWSYSTPLWYGQLIDGRRRDVWVVDDRTRLDEGLGDIYSVIDANLGRRTVYAIRTDPDEIARILRRYDVTYVPLAGGPSLMRIDGLRDRSA
jgi:hypothetical protein